MGLEKFAKRWSKQYREVFIKLGGQQPSTNYAVAKLTYANKKKQFITSQTLGSCDFQPVFNSVLNKVKSDIAEVLSSASDKAKLFAKTFSKNSDLDDSVMPLTAFLLELI